MTVAECEAEVENIESQITPTMTPEQKSDVCAQIHGLLDIIGTDPAYEASRIKLCGYITQLGCEPHSACGTT